jgi:hypothetical protein
MSFFGDAGPHSVQPRVQLGGVAAALHLVADVLGCGEHGARRDSTSLKP